MFYINFFKRSQANRDPLPDFAINTSFSLFTKFSSDNLPEKEKKDDFDCEYFGKNIVFFEGQFECLVEHEKVINGKRHGDQIEALAQAEKKLKAVLRVVFPVDLNGSFNGNSNGIHNEVLQNHPLDFCVKSHGHGATVSLQINKTSEKHDGKGANSDGFMSWGALNGRGFSIVQQKRITFCSFAFECRRKRGKDGRRIFWP